MTELSSEVFTGLGISEREREREREREIKEREQCSGVLKRNIKKTSRWLGGSSPNGSIFQIERGYVLHINLSV